MNNNQITNQPKEENKNNTKSIDLQQKSKMQNHSSANGKAIPQLRFPEFKNDGEWEEKHLESICQEIFSGGTPSTTNKNYYDGNIPFIRSGEINKETTELFLSEDGLTNSATKLIKKGDILVALYGANSGEVAIAKLDGAINQAILCLKSNSFNDFIYHYLMHKKKWLISTYTQGGQGNLSGEIVKSIIIKIPQNPKEQQKIADCLSSLDELIEAQTKKLETLRLHKKGLMQNLFPQEGETTPRLRFPEFKNDGDWEEKRLGDVAIKTASTISLNSLENNIGIYPVYGASGIIAKISSYQCVSEHIGIIKDGSGVGRVVLCLPKSSIIGTLDSIKANEKNFTKYIYYWLTIAPLNLYIIGGAIPHIYFKDYSKIRFLRPQIKEQQKIASCLSSLDELIEAQTKKLETLRLHKKGLMQQLFPNVSEVK